MTPINHTKYSVQSLAEPSKPSPIEKKKRADEADASARPRLQKAARPVYTGKRKQRTGGKPNVTTGGGGEVPAEALRLLEHGFDE